MGSSDVSNLEVGGFQAGDVLLHVTPPGGHRTELCRRLVTGRDRHTDVLRIAYGAEAVTPPGRSPGLQVRGNHEVVAVGVDRETVDARGRSVTAVESTEDLAGLGIVVSEHVERFARTDRPFAACFDGAGAVFENASFETGLEFLHVLTRQLSTAGATSHFHVDPGRTDRSTVSRIAVLFDAVLREAADGTLSVEWQ